MANYKKMVNGVEVEMSDEEQAEREAEEKTWADAAPTRAWKSLRKERDSLLANCDWTVAADTALSDSKKAEWVSYRTKLRDFPSTLNDTTVLDPITWPTIPE